MNCKLENEKEQHFRKQIIHGIVRDYGAGKTAIMCGLREDQTDLIYKYSNQNNNLDVPDKRWRILSQSLTNQKVPDDRIIREYRHPEVRLSLKKTEFNLNGCTLDELQGIVIELGEAEKNKESDKQQALKDVAKARVLLDQLEAEIRGMQ